MPIFFDRQQAAHLLAKKLTGFVQHKNTWVLGLAHGGAIMASTISQELNIPFNVLTSRKIGAPDNPELAVGGVAQDGTLWLSSSLVHLYKLSARWIETAQAKELKQAKDLAALYAKTKPLEPLNGKTIILVDDGIATGATVFVTLQSLRQQGVKTLIVAASVAPFAMWEQITKLADYAVCLHTPQEFTGVSTFYQHFEPVDDAAVIALLKST